MGSDDSMSMNHFENTDYFDFSEYFDSSAFGTALFLYPPPLPEHP